MKITFIGNFSVPYSTESHHLWTYRKLGHEVITLQENQTSVQEILNAGLQSDLVVWTHTHSFMPQGDIKGMLQRFKEAKIPVVGYHLDLWMGIERQKDLDNDPYWGIDYFFCTDKLMVDYLNNRPGMPKSFYLPAGVVESECYMAAPDKQRFPHDIIFVGSKGYHKEWPYRAKLVNWLQETYGDKFGHYGGDGLGVVRGHDLNVLYASAKVVVGDTLCINFDYPYYFSDRLFETTGRGGFMIFPYIRGIEEVFKTEIFGESMWADTPMPELATYPFDDFGKLKAMINYYITNDDRREFIRLAGFERTKRDHTYTQRLSQMLEIINNERNG